MTPKIIIFAGFLIVLYAALANRLFAFGRVNREEFATLADKMMLDEQPFALTRSQILRISDGLMGSGPAWHLVWYLVTVFFRSITGRRTKPAVPAVANDLVSAETTEDRRRFVRTAIMCVLATSPAALTIFIVLFAIASFVKPAGKLAEEALTEAATHSPYSDSDLCPPRQAA
ncbi:hypothetical protein [Methylobacterium sp. J-092]|uniref:hypothetical protein n=1 Tax=Methylobacterium sp. J-092 TaxID=2836667 RepID=UPI001FBBEE3A|nr:hypothetical protein [Methylobacterium sp. J-092]MCJ2009774.1 hypothetical protein [Methylobacterium sp. J-092]